MAGKDCHGTWKYWPASGPAFWLPEYEFIIGEIFPVFADKIGFTNMITAGQSQWCLPMRVRQKRFFSTSISKISCYVQKRSNFIFILLFGKSIFFAALKILFSGKAAVGRDFWNTVTDSRSDLKVTMVFVLQIYHVVSK